MNGVNINLAQYIVNEYSNINTQSVENVNTILKAMATGDIVKGNILDITGNQVTVGLDNNTNFTATLMDNVGVNIGDIVQFEVNNDNEQQVVLKVLENAKGGGDNPIAAKALNAANVAINEKTTALVMELVKNNMSISKENLQEFSRAINTFPEAEVTTLVRLSKLNLPITQENITQFENIKNFEHSISGKVDTISQEIVELTKEPSNIPLVKDILTSENMVEGAKVNEVVPKEQLAELTTLIKDEAFVARLNEGEISAKAFLEKVFQEEPEVLSKLIKSDGFKEVVTNHLREQLLLSPEDVAKNNEIKEFYTRILKQTDEIQKLLENSGKTQNTLFSQVTDIKENVMFMNNISQMMAYIQIPLKFANQNVHSDLYVFKGMNKKIDKDNISALLHLDMDNLGSMDVYINLSQGKNLSTRFCLENEEMLDFIMDHIDILNKRLETLGYNTSTIVNLASTEHDFVKEFVDEDIAEKEFLRYSFDIRA